jgi:hypothetical protein
VGSTWTVEQTSTAIDPANARRRGFDIAYEDVSQDLLAVYAVDTDTPVYRTLVGGVWSAETPLPLNDGGGPNPDPNTGLVQWIELTCRPGTDEVALGYLDANADLVTIVWDGAQWSTATAQLQESDVNTNALSLELSNRTFDIAYEHSSGGLLVVWAREGTSGFWFTTKDAVASAYTTVTQIPAAPNTGTPDFLDLAAEVGTDRIACGAFDLGGSAERLGLATWDGAAWADAGEYDSQMRDVNDTATGDFVGCVGWVGTSGVAACVYPDNQTGTLDWARWTAGGGWAIQTDVAMAGKGFTESAVMRTFGAKDELMVIVSDSNLDLYALTYDGSAWVVMNGGVRLMSDLSSIAATPFSLAIKR